MLGSSIFRVVPDYRIDFGRVASRFANRDPQPFPEERTEYRQTRGAVSVKRGGGAFEFTIAPRDNPALDNEDLVVIGYVIPASLPTLDALNSIPSKRSPFDLNVPPLGSSFARACEYSSPDPTCAQFKPLRKVSISRITLISDT